MFDVVGGYTDVSVKVIEKNELAQIEAWDREGIFYNSHWFKLGNNPEIEKDDEIAEALDIATSALKGYKSQCQDGLGTVINEALSSLGFAGDGIYNRL